MDVKIDSEGAFGSAIVTLEAGEKFVSEAGAMYRACLLYTSDAADES